MIDRLGHSSEKVGGTGASGRTRGLAILPQGGSRSLQWSEIRTENLQEDHPAVHCFCVCIGGVLLGDLLGLADPENVIFCLSCRFILGFSCAY